LNYTRRDLNPAYYSDLLHTTAMYCAKAKIHPWKFN